VLSKIRSAAGTCHSVLTKRCAFRRRAKVAVDIVDRRSSAGKLFQVSGLETAKFLWPMAVALRCTSSLPEAADRRCRCPARWTTGRQSSARYGGARPHRHLLTSITILYRCCLQICKTSWCLVFKLLKYSRSYARRRKVSFWRRYMSVLAMHVDSIVCL